LVSRSALLRNIRTSGGLFTENILLRLRDFPNQLKIGQIKSFIKKDTAEDRKSFREKRKNVYEWCVQKWDEISLNIEKWPLDEIIEKWLVPFFSQFEHELEEFKIKPENIDEDNPLKNFLITYESKGHIDPFFNFVNIEEDFDSKIESNPQKKSHHEVCQQFINLNPEIKWLFLFNGRILRILTKYYHSYSKGYVEFDLENIFANRDLVEFNVLYSIIHISRFQPIPTNHIFLIDEFQEESTKEGVKIGDSLRDNVHDALELLGNGLIQENLDFIDKIRNDEVDLQEFYAELLRIIYRIIFILYAEQRDMLPGAGTLYFEQFSLSSLRFLAERPIKAEKNYDLWNKLFITFELVREGNEFLEVPCYNGALFKNENLKIIIENGLKVSNDIILNIIRLLTTSVNNNLRQRINFLEISEEEIGSIYESLLDFKPYLNPSSQFQLIYQTTERKSTGSYYTPKALIDILIRTTLQPLVENRLKDKTRKDDKENEILDLKVCDPACGGGTFLLAALDFLGKKLAEIRTETDSPPEHDLRQARRDILQHCIYGVDKNPLAVELAKISLWLRACVKDKPLNFLDNHIKCGNSLIGLDQKREISSINPNAFKAIKGNKETGIDSESTKLQNSARKLIRKEIQLQKDSKTKMTRLTQFFTEGKAADICSKEFQKIIDLPEDTLELIKIKEQKYEKVKKFQEYRQALIEANIWTSSYFWPLEGETLGKIPSLTLIYELRNNKNFDQNLRVLQKITAIAKENQFFHWYIEFPEVFSSDCEGFDCILTNPPWDVYTLKTDEFFLHYDKNIAKARSKKRAQLIKELKVKKPEIFNKYYKKRNHFEKGKNYFKNSKMFDFTAKQQLDLYPMFVERSFYLLNNNGSLGVVCPNGIINSYSDFFEYLYQNNNIRQCVGFINTNGIFPAVASQKQFLTLSLSKFFMGKTSFLFNIEETDLAYDEKNYFFMDFNELCLINPITKTPPFIKNQFEFLLLKKIYQNSKLLMINIKDNEEGMKIHRMFHITDDRRKGILLYKEELEEKKLELDIKTQIYHNNKDIKYLPIYEGKMIYQYDYLHGTYKDVDYETRTSRRARCNRNENKNLISVEPRYWVEEKEFLKKINEWGYEKKWFLCYRESTGPKNNRTIIFTILPWFPTVYTIYCYIQLSAKEALIFLSQFNTYIMDFIFRKKMATNHLTQNDIAQLPFVPMDLIDKNIDLILPLVWELVYFNESLKPLSKELNLDSETIFKYDKDRRYKLKRQLDAIYAHLWNLNEEEIMYILKDFEVEKKKEIEKFGEFLSQKMIIKYFREYEKKLRK